jgi:hypothetical protein
MSCAALATGPHVELVSQANENAEIVSLAK